jgi:hypothetical protein
MPTFSSNDRSRWATVRALVEEGTYEVGRRDPRVVVASGLGPLGATDALSAAALASGGYQLRVGSDQGIVFEDGWGTVDKVLQPETLKFYSSKPPLLPTLVAGEYWLLKKGLGWTLTENPFAVVRTVLLTVNLLPMLLYFGLLARLAGRYAASDWGRNYVLAAACFGTMLTPFAVTFNNHTPAACFALFALYPALRCWDADPDAPCPFWALALSGFCAGFTAACELPAAAFAAALGFVLFVRWPGRTLTAFLPAALLPAAALLLTNYWAIGEWMPAYGKIDSPWYRYEGSHWRVEPGQVKWGIDFLTEPKRVYAFHLLFGHHGLFSLTPVLLLAVAGMVWAVVRAFRGKRREAAEPTAGLGRVVAWLRGLPGWELTAGLTLVLTVTMIDFYVYETNNYGGWTSGPRWLMWLTPLWLVTMLPVADWLAGRRWGRALGYALLAVSVLSMSYPAWNPWRHPWLQRWMQSQGWIDY